MFIPLTGAFRPIWVRAQAIQTVEPEVDCENHSLITVISLSGPLHVEESPEQVLELCRQAGVESLMRTGGGRASPQP